MELLWNYYYYYGITYYGIIIIIIDLLWNNTQLNYYGIRETAFEWFKSYLSGRTRTTGAIQ